jgi:hypothetical protein
MIMKWYYQKGHSQGQVADEETGKTVALVYSNGDEGYIIAAAPDMLAALKDLMFFCEEMNPRETMPEVWDKAREAIAKATGE